MAKKDQKIELLCEEFDKLVVESAAKAEESKTEGAKYCSEESSDTDDDTRRLRSGSAHLRVPPSTVTNTQSVTHLPSMSQTNSSGGSGSTPPFSTMPSSNPIKCLPVVAGVRNFSGNDPDHSAYDYIEQCEDVMRHSYVTADADKISFLRSHLQVASPAAHAMRASAFTDPTERQDYDEFRTNFLETFGDDRKHGLVKGVSDAVHVILERAGSLNIIQAKADANRLASNMTRHLSDNGWVQGGSSGSMPLKDTHKFLEFFFFMTFIKEKGRKTALPLEYGPQETLHSFSMKLRTKVEERGGDARFAAAAATDCVATSAVAAAQSSSGLSAEQPSASYAAVTSTGREKIVCYYCQREGHMANKCNKKKRDKRQGAATARGQGSRDSSPRVKSASRKPTGAAQSDSGRSSNAYCSLHQRYGHSTDECFSVIKLREQWKQGGAVGKNQSGEASRQGRTKPG